MKYKFNYSIIIPNYTPDDNISDLTRAVSSIPERNDIEIIIVDNSPNQIRKDLFSNRKNVTIDYSEKNKGAGRARNKGIELSSSKWLLFLDADDFFTDNAFEIFDKYLKANEDIIYTTPTGVYGNNIKKKSQRGDFYANTINDYIKTGDETDLRIKYRSPVAKMIKSSLVKNNGIKFDEVPAGNDVMFSLRTGLLAKQISADSGITYVITLTEGSLTRTQSLKNIESRFNVALNRNKYLKKNGYKKDSSVMYFILESKKFGIIPFLRMLFKAIITGNLFVGCKNWISTSKKIKRQSDAKKQ